MRTIRHEILARLTSIETERGVKVLYACESGSRAWGFPSSDSDYDVRFLYIRPPSWYLSIDFEAKRDVIDHVDCPIVDEIDLSGWDLRKALGLLRKSNPPLLEWMGSPIIYWERYSAVDRMRALARDYYSLSSCIYHYLHMARSNYREYLQGDQVRIKKYFYVLRPLLAIKWLEQGRGVVPTEFKTLVDQIATSEKLKIAVEDLIESKKQGEELGYGAPIPVISDFIDSELERLESLQLDSSASEMDTDDLNRVFRNTLDEAWY